MPAKVEGVIAEPIARLDDELQELLTVGSVEGEEFIAEVLARVENLAVRDVGEILEALFGDGTEAVAGRLARHFEVAGIYEKAALYHLQAGNQARRVLAHPEAIAHLNQGLALLASFHRVRNERGWS